MQAVAKMEDGFADADIFDGGGGAAVVQPPTPKAAPHDPTKPSRKRGRETSEWADDVEAGDGGATARGRSGRVSSSLLSSILTSVVSQRFARSEAHTWLWVIRGAHGLYMLFSDLPWLLQRTSLDVECVWPPSSDTCWHAAPAVPLTSMLTMHDVMQHASMS